MFFFMFPSDAPQLHYSLYLSIMFDDNYPSNVHSHWGGNYLIIIPASSATHLPHSSKSVLVID